MSEDCLWPCACEYRCEYCGSDARYPVFGLTLVTASPVMHLCWVCYEGGNEDLARKQRRVRT